MYLNVDLDFREFCDPNSDTCHRVIDTDTVLVLDAWEDALVNVRQGHILARYTSHVMTVDSNLLVAQGR